MNQISVPFSQLYKTQWNKISTIPGILRSNLNFIHSKMAKQFKAFFNRQLIENKRETQIEFDEQTNFEIVKDFDESAFNFNLVQPEEILFYINLETEEMILPNIFEELKSKNELENEESFHPIMINVSPICLNHSIIALYPQQCMPQVVGTDILQLVISLFSVENDPSFKIGYNSIGAFASVNHLHFQLLYSNDLIEGSPLLPIEKANLKAWFKNSLQNQTEKEVQMVVFSTLDDYPVRAFVLKTEGEASAESYQSISYAAGSICEILLEKSIPFNLLLSDQGRTVFVIPRQFEKKLAKDHNLKPAFLEISGIAVCRNKNFFEAFTAEQFQDTLDKEVSLNQEEFEQLKNKVLDRFSKFK